MKIKRILQEQQRYNDKNQQMSPNNTQKTIQSTRKWKRLYILSGKKKCMKRGKSLFLCHWVRLINVMTAPPKKHNHNYNYNGYNNKKNIKEKRIMRFLVVVADDSVCAVDSSSISSLISLSLSRSLAIAVDADDRKHVTLFTSIFMSNQFKSLIV